MKANKEQKLVSAAINSTMPYFVAEFLGCETSMAKRLIRTSFEAAQLGNMLCQFRFNNKQVSFRYYPCDDMMRFSILSSEVVSIYCDLHGVISIEEIRSLEDLEEGGKK